MSATAIVPMVAANMSRHEPLHPATQVPVVMGPQEQMKVIAHQAVPCQPHRDMVVSLKEEIDKCRIILILVEDPLACISPI